MLHVGMLHVVCYMLHVVDCTAPVAGGPLPGAWWHGGLAHSVAQIRSDFKGKTVLLVDDSIVRGTTSKELVIMVRNIATDGTQWAGSMQRTTCSRHWVLEGTDECLGVQAREAGSKAVFFASAAPPIRFPNVYGVPATSAPGLAMDSIARSHIGAGTRHGQHRTEPHPRRHRPAAGTASTCPRRKS